MSEKVIVLMDNDGVLNACKTRQVKGYLGAYACQLDAHLSVSPKTPILKKYNRYLDFSRSVVDYFGALQDTDMVSFSWCSEWCENADYKQLNEAYGYSVEHQVWRAQCNQDGRIDKLAIVLHTIECNPNTPVLWIDDEACDYSAYALLRDKLVNGIRTAPIMMVRPETAIGLSEPQMNMLAAFIQGPECFDDKLVFVCSPNGQMVKEFADIYSEDVTCFLRSVEWSYSVVEEGILRSRSVLLPSGFGVVAENGGVRSWPGNSVRVTEHQVKKGVHPGAANAPSLEDTFRYSDVLHECKRTMSVSERC